MEYKNLVGCGGCGNHVEVKNTTTCIQCGIMLCGSCGVFCSYHRNKLHIEEMPQGCVLSQNGKEIVISDPDSAVAIIRSLAKLLKVQFPEYTFDVLMRQDA